MVLCTCHLIYVFEELHEVNCTILFELLPGKMRFWEIKYLTQGHRSTFSDSIGIEVLTLITMQPLLQNISMSINSSYIFKDQKFNYYGLLTSISSNLWNLDPLMSTTERQQNWLINCIATKTSEILISICYQSEKASKFVN